MRMNANISKIVLTLSLGSAVAFAQATTPQAGTPDASPKKATTSDAHGQGKHSADHGMSTNQGAGLMVGKPDEQFLIKAAQGGMMEVEAARLAQEKASSSEVKDYARKLEQDHTKANDQLKQLASQKNVQLPTDMGPHKAMVDKIRNLSGDQFDKAFIKMQVSDHRKDVNEFQKESTRAMDSDVKNFASTTLPTLQEHLRMAQELQGGTRGRKADKTSTTTTTDKSNPTSASAEKK